MSATYCEQPTLILFQNSLYLYAALLQQCDGCFDFLFSSQFNFIRSTHLVKEQKSLEKLCEKV